MSTHLERRYWGSARRVGSRFWGEGGERAWAGVACAQALGTAGDVTLRTWPQIRGDGREEAGSSRGEGVRPATQRAADRVGRWLGGRARCLHPGLSPGGTRKGRAASALWVPSTARGGSLLGVLGVQC